MKNVQKIDLGLTGYDELFANDEERKVNKLPRIFDIPISEIDDFPDHPFKVKIDEDMDQLVQSIKERGIITPVTLRPKEDGRYEIVSGHRRKKACELAGLNTVKAEVREMSRDEAIILMVESNLQRSTIERCYMKSDEKEMIDVIFGPFFICDCSGPNYGSLNQEQIDRFMKQFENPERLIRMNGTLMSVPYKPEPDLSR